MKLKKQLKKCDGHVTQRPVCGNMKEMSVESTGEIMQTKCGRSGEEGTGEVDGT